MVEPGQGVRALRGSESPGFDTRGNAYGIMLAHNNEGAHPPMNDAIFIEVQRLCRLVHLRGLRELAITRPDFSVTLTAVRRGAVTITPAAPAPSTLIAAPTVEGTPVASPLVGIFYRSASPDSPPFVEIGDAVEVGQVIGIVEAMKVFNEIISDYAGTVTAIPAENGKVVQVGQPLVIIDRKGVAPEG